ncbi:hypothetical protein RND81_10G108000 [Saponaria officinalis]|uniref:Protein kinase domain-containing protein n=1 Tax=Saponaria officinalis TaxID=3572 RepID=A0AAW1I1G4_SAPOF
MKLPAIFRFFHTHHQHQHQDQDQHQLQQGSSGLQWIFRGNNENFIKNGALLLQERLSLFDGITNPIHCFSVDDINDMNVQYDLPFPGRPINSGVSGHPINSGVWDGKSVMVKRFRDYRSGFACREIAVATQMANHTNVHRLLGCCLHTECPILVYEWAENGTLYDRIYHYKEHNKEPLVWKERLRVAWEIAHAAAYLHTAFRRPIIHRDLNPSNVFLDQNDSARLSHFCLTISIPKGKTHVEDEGYIGRTFGYISPDYYLMSGRVAESSDVYSFGILLLVLITGKHVHFPSELDRDMVNLVDWVRNCCAVNCVTDIVDPAINIDGVVAKEHFGRQLKALVQFALRCSAEDKERRPTMVDVATHLENMITSLSDSL